MSSGFRNVVINPRERAISTDINRLQSMIGYNLAEILRFMTLGSQNNSVSEPFYPTDPANAPLQATIIEGLGVTFDSATTRTYVSPGAMVTVGTATDADDNTYKVVIDPGVNDGSLYPLTPNTSGSTRFDIFECSIEDALEETATRQMYDESTDSFADATVSKVRAYHCVYQLRAGTPGGGIPAFAPGWLPLMIAWVPNGATIWSQCKCWDVRPLMSDFIHSTMAVTNTYQNHRKAVVAMDAGVLDGYAIAISAKREVGGELNTGGATIDITSASNQEASFATSTNHPWYVYAAFPKSLPRWLQYNMTTGTTSYGMKGIPVVSRSSPTYGSGQPLTPITMPTWFADSSLVYSAACLFAGMSPNDTNFPDTLTIDGIGTYQGGGSWGECPHTIDATTHDSNSGTFNFVEGTNFPCGARAIYVTFNLTTSTASTNNNITTSLAVYNDAGSLITQFHQKAMIVISGAAISESFPARIAIHNPGSLDTTWKVIYSYYAPSSVSVTSITARVTGWEM